MNVRRIALALLILCLLGGLVSAFFTPAIAATLTLPATPGTGRAPVQVHAQPTPTTVVQAEPTNQPTPLPDGAMMLAHDTFQRPDQQFWGTASDGRVWESDARTNPAFAIVSQAGQITGGDVGVTLQAVINVTSTNAEILFSGTVNQFDANGNTNLGGVLRWTDANNWYKVLIDGSKLQLLKRVNGGTSQILASQPFQATAGTSYSVRFRVLGSSLFAKVWPSTQAEPANWMLRVIDTALTSGVGGIRVRLAPGAVIRVTSFLETTVSNTW